jgi:hypothetical protein
MRHCIIVCRACVILTPLSICPSAEASAVAVASAAPGGVGAQLDAPHSYQLAVPPINSPPNPMNGGASISTNSRRPFLPLPPLSKRVADLVYRGRLARPVSGSLHTSTFEINLSRAGNYMCWSGYGITRPRHFNPSRAPPPLWVGIRTS